MNFELTIRENEYMIWVTVLVAVLLVMIVGMAFAGRGVTVVDSAGNPQILTWSDWRMIQAQRAYDAELSVLRNDAVRVAATLDQQRPNPVAAQIVAENVARDTQSGDPSLASARAALAAAALNVRDWSTGVLDRATAVQSVQQAIGLLQ